MELTEILDILCTEDGVSGDEHSAAEAAFLILKDIASCKTDGMGNLIAEIGSGEKHILFDAHIDQIGLIVTGITEDGFLRIDKCGGVDVRTLFDAEVTVYGEKSIDGIICCIPPHLKSTGDTDTLPDVNELFIDIGMNAEKAKTLVPLGSRVSLKQKSRKLQNSLYCCKSVDDRAGAAALILCAERLSKEKPHCRVSFLFSCREETGGNGAKVAAFGINPDICVAVDVSFAKTPGCKAEECGIINKGPMIGVSPVLSRGITDTLTGIAKSRNGEYQLEVMGGTTGTNADEISVTRCGVKCGLVSIPIKYMHTGTEVVSLNDIEATADLLYQFAKCGGELL